MIYWKEIWLKSTRRPSTAREDLVTGSGHEISLELKHRVLKCRLQNIETQRTIEFTWISVLCVKVDSCEYVFSPLTQNLVTNVCFRRKDVKILVWRSMSEESAKIGGSGLDKRVELEWVLYFPQEFLDLRNWERWGALISSSEYVGAVV